MRPDWCAGGVATWWGMSAWRPGGVCRRGELVGLAATVAPLRSAPAVHIC